MYIPVRLYFDDSINSSVVPKASRHRNPSCSSLQRPHPFRRTCRSWSSPQKLHRTAPYPVPRLRTPVTSGNAGPTPALPHTSPHPPRILAPPTVARNFPLETPGSPQRSAWEYPAGTGTSCLQDLWWGWWNWWNWSLRIAAGSWGALVRVGQLLGRFGDYSRMFASLVRVARCNAASPQSEKPTLNIRQSITVNHSNFFLTSDKST